MNDTSSGFWILTLLTAVPAAIGSFALEHNRKQRMPNTQPYTWGFYIGLNGTFFGIALLAIGLWIALGSTGQEAGGGFVLVVLGLVTAVPGYFTVRRSRVAFIAATILSLNIVWWIANTIYIRNRWSEMAPNVKPAEASEQPSTAAAVGIPPQSTSKEEPIAEGIRPAPTTGQGRFE